MATLHLHHLENSRSFRILWLLEELKINSVLDYQLTRYERTKSYLAPASLKKIHPSGKSPILEVNMTDTIEPRKISSDHKNSSDHNSSDHNKTDKQTVMPLIESGHIIDYLMAKYDSSYQLHPQTDADSQMWRDYDFWMHYAEGSAMPALVMRLVFTKIVERSPVFIRPVTKRVRKQVERTMISPSIKTSLKTVERQLSDNHWFAGSEFSAADIQMAFVIEAVQAGQRLNVTKHSNTLNWLKRCQARPAYKAAVEKGGKLDF